MLYGIGVHIAFPGTMYTKGYEEENACKPKITLKIEETDGGWEPEFVANTILKGTSLCLVYVCPLPILARCASRQVPYHCGLHRECLPDKHCWLVGAKQLCAGLGARLDWICEYYVWALRCPILSLLPGRVASVATPC